MILDLLIRSALRRAKKPLLVPFPRSMWGGQRLPEEIIRLNYTHQLWDTIQTIEDKQVDILCCGGLANKNGLTLARDMTNYLTYSWPDIISSIILGEEKSTWTGQQIHMMRNQILSSGYDLIIPISNKWHLLRIGVHLKYWYPGIPIVKSASPSYGSQIDRFINVGREMLLYSIALTDRSGQRFDSAEEKRNAEAALKPQ